MDQPNVVLTPNYSGGPPLPQLIMPVTTFTNCPTCQKQYHIVSTPVKTFFVFFCDCVRQVLDEHGPLTLEKRL